MENIIYPAIYGRDGEEHYVSFPNGELIDCVGKTMENVVSEATDVLGLYLVDLLDEGRDIFPPKEDEIELEENEKIIYLSVWMPYYFAKVKTEYKKKTLTIPTWLELLATRRNINFSRVLVDALKAELGISTK